MHSELLLSGITTIHMSVHSITYQISNKLELTKACKFSNFFTVSVCLGSEVNGQVDTIRASSLFGNDCWEKMITRNIMIDSDKVAWIQMSI